VLSAFVSRPLDLLDLYAFHSFFQSRQHHDADPRFTEKFFTQTLDHFNFNSMGNGTFNQRYLITDQYWEKGFGPIFFYTGNEGDIWEFALNSGFITELAAQQRALVIFAEHRYYGKSLPFEKDSFNIPQISLLTVEQALADYAIMITELKQQLGATDLFGNQTPDLTGAAESNYGGMLSVYMRIKYPNIVAGALAASAPILSTAGLGDSRQFFQDVASVSFFLSFSPKYRHIQSAFGLCKPLSSAQDIHQLNGFLRNAFTLMAMLDYPYSTHFMGNMPANPVKVACETMLRGSDLLGNLRDTAAIVYNATGILPCFDLYSLYLECADPTGCGLGFDSLAWDYQIELCYESNNVTDMFPPMPFTEEDRRLYCSKRWGVVPRPGWLNIQFWGDALSTASNIIFSNGDLDPWANGGVRTSLSDSLIALNISGGAHHLDLRGSNEADPVSVISARKTEADLIALWVKMERTRLQKLV
uniref:Dipeptidyl-peptidase 7 n=1 Tax=Neolamprologus brichardi TaxID=32507 RepID=A0A3Q4H0R9_NEOBR